MAYYGIAFQIGKTFSLESSKLEELHTLASQLIMHFIKSEIADRDIFFIHSLNYSEQRFPRFEKYWSIFNKIEYLLPYRCEEADSEVIKQLYKQIRKPLIRSRVSPEFAEIYEKINARVHALPPLSDERITKRYRKSRPCS